MRITIITSCSRPENLSLLFESIKFDFVEKWIIIYDTSKGNKYNWMYKNNPKILEAECPDEGVFGNAQKNFGLKFVKGGQVYFLDDDNIMHPNFWNIILSLKEDCVYMWDRLSYLYLSKDVYEVGSELINEIALNIKSDIGRIESGTCINDFGIYYYRIYSIFTLF